ncbi:MAG: recombinase, partial [Alphaproteobacteria bacterium]|nr:recombinase [Alphaproteobacteria bacterium]
MAVFLKPFSLLDRIVDSSSDSVIKAYEDRITTLEKEKLVMAEKMQKQHKPQRSFDEMFELAIAFLGNPQKL